MNAPKNIVLFGDLHAGSHYAPWPADWIPEGPKRYVGSRYVTECLTHYLREDAPKEIDLLLLTGDLIDGTQRKSKSTGIFTAHLGEQVNGAVELLRPLCERAKEIIRFDGTPYHEEFHGALGKLDAALGVSHAQFRPLDIELPGGLLNVAHHPTGGACLYKGTSSDREGLWALIASAMDKVRRPRWIVRAHTHFYSTWDTEGMSVIQTPCWQLPTPYATKQAHWRWQPTLGALTMDRDGDEYRLRKHFYEVPKDEVHRYGQKTEDADAAGS